MLKNEQKTNLLYKEHMGWGDTRSSKEIFEENYRSFSKIYQSRILMYGNLIPTSDDESLPITVSQVRALDTTNPTIHYDVSKIYGFDIIKKCFKVKFTQVSPNCDDAFVLLDENSNQIENVIPFDLYEDVYNYKLEDSKGNEIPYGLNDWTFDIDSSILTFYNGVPDNVSADNPPYFTFYQYVGPTGAKSYIDALFFDESVKLDANVSVVDVTGAIQSFLDTNIGATFYEDTLFNGNDTNEGLGLSYNKITPIIDATTNDPINGYDDRSNTQVVSLLSHITGTSTSEGVTVAFASEGLEGSTKTISLEEGTHLYQFDNALAVITSTSSQEAEITFDESDAIKLVTLVKDTSTGDYELYTTRENREISFKFPVFVDLINLPPSLKLSEFNSYSDSLTPQYYGPRTKDYVIASDKTSIDNKSADAIVYDTDASTASIVMAKADEGAHTFYFRNGTYKLGTIQDFKRNVVIEGESKEVVFTDGTLSTVKFEANEITFVNITFDSTCDLRCTGGKVKVNFINCNIQNTKNALTIVGGTEVIISKTIVAGAVLNTASTLTIDAGSYVNELMVLGAGANGKFYVSGSSIGTLRIPLPIPDGSIIDTTRIGYVESKPKNVKMESSYVVQYSSQVDQTEVPDSLTIPFYKSFTERVYSKFTNPIHYDSQSNSLGILIDTEYHTLFIDEDTGELRSRFYTDEETSVTATIKTQYQDHYDDHQDTTLYLVDENGEYILDDNGNKIPRDPKNVKEALEDLYWAKADLKNGKVPLQQLPDSVAYGGLHYVGVWSFEDSEGAYPTFEDVDNKYSEDEEVDQLQRGWFFIVDASHDEDHKAKDQPAVLQDGEEEALVFTAGDWVVWNGSKWDKVDRAFQEVVYHLLPSLAPENKEWSYVNGGEGYYDFKNTTIYEAMDLLNQALLANANHVPNPITTISIDNITTGSKVQYNEISSSSTSAVVKSDVLEAFDVDEFNEAHFQSARSSIEPFENCFYTGLTYDDPVVEVSGTSDDWVTFTLDKFNPFTKWNVAVQGEDVGDIGAQFKIDVAGISLEEGVYSKTIGKRVSVTWNVQLPEILPNKHTKAYYSGTTVDKDNSIEYRKLYRLSEVSFARDGNGNADSIKSSMKSSQGISYLVTQPTTFTGSVKVTKAFGCNSVPNCEGDLTKLFTLTCDGANAETSITNVTISKNGEFFDAKVNWSATINPEGDQLYSKVDFYLEERGFYDDVAKSDIIYEIRNMQFIDSSNEDGKWTRETLNRVNSGYSPAPKLAIDKTVAENTTFGGDFDYAALVSDTEKGYELLYDALNDVYTWPNDDIKQIAFNDDEDKLQLEVDDSYHIISSDSGTVDITERYVSCLFDLGEIKDVSGIMLQIEYDDADKVSVSSTTGTLNEMSLRVGVASDELAPIASYSQSMDGNSPVPFLHECTFTSTTPLLYPGKSTKELRRLTFGRKPIPVQQIYVRLGVKFANHDIGIKSIKLVEVI